MRLLSSIEGSFYAIAILNRRMVPRRRHPQRVRNGFVRTDWAAAQTG
jgi:hypothetical protein